MYKKYHFIPRKFSDRTLNKANLHKAVINTSQQERHSDNEGSYVHHIHARFLLGYCVGAAGHTNGYSQNDKAKY